jgi:peptide deformylase
MNQLFSYVPRPRKVKIRYFDLKGQEALLDAKDLFSHIIQHEIDHMYGKLFIDYIDDPNEIMTLAELNERTKNQGHSTFL